MTFRGLASVKELRRDAAVSGLKPPPRLSLSQWADERFRLSAESSAVPGRWKTLPYQIEPMDCMSDPTVQDVTMMKSARIGYTLMICAAVGYRVDQAPCNVLLVQPRVEDAKAFSKDTIAPMIRDVPVLTKKIIDVADGPKGSDNTIQEKSYPGGRLSLIGANSGAGFRRRSCKVVLFDEADTYPESAGSDGDPIKLGKKRSEYFWDRKHIMGSTPLIAGRSRIEAAFLAGDQRRFHVPCPHCGHMDYLVFTEKPGQPGHSMKWPKDAAGKAQPEEAYFQCGSGLGCVIEHKDKRAIVARGKWIAAAPFKGHASFHIWAAYSFSPGATWAQIAQEFLESKHDPKLLRTFVNTTMGETFKESGEAPDWERLYLRREKYAIGTVPAGVKFLTCGVDVQKDRFVYEVVGWAPGKESWSIDAGIILGDPSNEADWLKLDDLLGRSFPCEGGPPMGIERLAIDSGYNTQAVYGWARAKGLRRVIAVKGASTTVRTLVSAPTDVDVTQSGRRIARGAKVWLVGGDIAKTELYGFLRIEPPKEAGAPYPRGFCHFPEHGEDWFKQLTGEHLVSTVSGKGFTVYEWQLIPGRENHWLDARVYARAAAFVVGLDRMFVPASVAATPPKEMEVVAAAAVTVPQGSAPEHKSSTPAPPRRIGGGFLGGRSKPWLR